METGPRGTMPLSSSEAPSSPMCWPCSPNAGMTPTPWTAAPRTGCSCNDSPTCPVTPSRSPRPLRPHPRPSACCSVVANLRPETAAVSLRSSRGAQHCACLCESLCPSSLIHLYRGPISVVGGNRRAARQGAHPQPSASGDRGGAPLPRLGRPSRGAPQSSRSTPCTLDAASRST